MAGKCPKCGKDVSQAECEHVKTRVRRFTPTEITPTGIYGSYVLLCPHCKTILTAAFHPTGLEEISKIFFPKVPPAQQLPKGAEDHYW
jgi:phage FluMu protein Com